MIEITLQAVANQSFTATLDGARYGITLKEANGAMCADVTRNGVVLVSGMRVLTNTPLLPYPYMQVGNFVLYSDDDELAYYTGFGVTQFLYYVSAAEIAALIKGS